MPLRALLGYGIPAGVLALFFDTAAVQMESGRSIGDAIRQAELAMNKLVTAARIVVFVAAVVHSAL